MRVYVCLLACLLACLEFANTVNFKSANFTCTCTIIFKFNNELYSIRGYAPRYAMQGIVNRLATCSTDDNDNKDGETTRGHWLEHHEHSASSVATLTKAETAAQSRGPTVAPWPVIDVGARLLQLQTLTCLTVAVMYTSVCLGHNFCGLCSLPCHSHVNATAPCGTRMLFTQARPPMSCIPLVTIQHTDFVFIGLYTASSFKRLQSSSNLALDTDVQGALPAVQTSLFVGNV